MYYIGCVTIKDLWYMKTGSVNFLYLINKINGYIEERNRNKYLVLVPADESKDTLKKYEELWSKMKISSDQKLIAYMIMMKILWKSNLIWTMTYLLSNEKLELHIFVRAVFHEGNKYYPQAFLDECL